MSSRKNFLDADNSMMERNLRFVKNDLEDNLNQYFGGSGGSRGNSTAISAPPREYKVVQPKPGGYHALKPAPDLEERKQFLIEIGLARHEAYNLAKSSNFKVNYYTEIRNNWLKSGLKEEQVNQQLLSEIIESGDYKCDNYKTDNIAGDDHQQRSFRKSIDGDRDRDQYINRSNEINYGSIIMLDEPSEISRYQSYDEDPDSLKQLKKGDYILTSRSTSSLKGFNSMQPEIRIDDSFKSTQASRSRSPPRELNSKLIEYNYSATQYDRPLERSISSQPSTSRSPPSGFNSMEQERGRSRGFDNLRSSQPSTSRSPGLNFMQQERGFDNLRSSQLSRSPPSDFNSLQPERGRSRGLDNLRSSQASISRSPGFNSLQHERGRSRDLDNLRSSQLSRSRSPPSGFNSMTSEKSCNNNVTDFQLSRMRLISNLCNTKQDRDSSKNNTNFMEPLNKTNSEPLSKTSSYGCKVANFQETQLGFGNQLTKPKVAPLLVDYTNFQENQLGFGNQLTKPNVAPLKFDYTTLFKRRRDINDQDLGNPMQWENKFPNTTSLKSNTNSPSQSYWIGAGNNRNTPPKPGNRNVASNYNDIQVPSLLGLPLPQLTTPDYSKCRNQPQGYWIGASNSANNPSKDYQNPPSNDNTFRDKPTSVSTPLPIIQHNPFNNPYGPQPPTMTEIMKNSTGRKLTFKQQRQLAHKEQLKAASKLKNKKKQEKRREREVEKLNDPYKPPVSSVPLITCDLHNAPPGRSKAHPQEYWSQWWPHFKYIEKSIQKLNISLKPEDVIPPPRNNLLLNIGINKILQFLDITEHNYHVRDILKFFKYKKQLENPIFQNSLKGFNLKNVKAVLAQLENKQKLALLHQSLIHRWHFSLDTVKRSKAGELIKSGKAFNLLGDKIFHYFVLESIQQLKEMCTAEWPQFEEFYNSIDSTNDETDISPLLFSTKEYCARVNAKYEEQDVQEDDDVDDEQGDEDNNDHWMD